MLIVIALAIGSSLYIPSYQQVYSQAQPLVLYVGASDSPIIKILEDEGYSISENSVIPSDPGAYNVIILDGSIDSQGVVDIIEYVENGGGLVYLSAAAESLDLATNHDWLGAQELGFSGFGDNATVSSNSPFGSNLLAGAPLRSQTGEQFGAMWVNDLESEADPLAIYESGNVFAYSYESAGGRVYFQAYSDAGVGMEPAPANVEELLKLGILWSTTESSPVTNLLPPGTVVAPENNEPFGSVAVVFSQPGPQSIGLSVPDSTKSIFVTADAGLVSPILFFEIEGQEYHYNVQIDEGALLTFPSFVNITNARFEVDDWSGGVGTVGYVNLRSVPSCNVPAGAEVTGPSSLPPDAAAIGSTGPLGSVSIAIPPVPVTSVLVGFDHEVSGYLLSFESGGAQFRCPIQPEVINIEFSEPTVVSDATVENDGPWGLVGYIENLGDATAYARSVLPKETALPDGITIQPDLPAPSKVYSASFSQDQVQVLEVASPSSKVSALWISADANLVDPFAYFRIGDKWYALDISQSSSSLVTFPVGVVLDEVYVSSDGGQAGTVTVGYFYPIKLNARAGFDQSVQEEQIVYLDGRASTGPVEAMSFKWTQIEGPIVTLRDANTATAHFDAPSVDESGARMSFRLVVTDSEGGQSSDIVVINVKNELVPRNSPPEIGTIAGATVNEGTHVVLAASAFDSDGDPLKYLWTQTDGPGAVLSGKNMATLSFNAPEVSSDTVLSFELKVADGQGHAVTRAVLVTVINVQNEISIEPIISAGQDQVVLEGSVVQLAGHYQAGESGYQEFRWEQMGGPLVTLEKSSLLNASFVAPQIEEDASRLNFRLGIFDSQGALVKWDDVSVTVNNTALVQVIDNSETKQEDPSSFEVSEPTFTAVKRVDIEPPSEIHLLSIPGAAGANSPTPTAPVVGIWINATLDMVGLELHFGSSGRQYSIGAEANQATAYVFDREVEIKDVRLTASSDVQSIGIGYYYGQVPLSSVPTASITSGQEEPASVVAMPPTEGAIIKFARENQVIAGLVAIGVPVGIGVGLKLASTSRRKKMNNPAKALFGKSDPVAGEAEKVRPVIEELERMLGRNLDTALSASELLDRFGSGRNEVSQR